MLKNIKSKYHRFYRNPINEGHKIHSKNCRQTSTTSSGSRHVFSWAPKHSLLEKGKNQGIFLRSSRKLPIILTLLIML